jgi:hypothetical protein
MSLFGTGLELRDTSKDPIKALVARGLPLSRAPGGARPPSKSQLAFVQGIGKSMAVEDMQAARRTYDGFTSLIKWSIPVIAVIVIFVVILIS